MHVEVSNHKSPNGGHISYLNIQYVEKRAINGISRGFHYKHPYELQIILQAFHV
jgi:hypothetical protein